MSDDRPAEVEEPKAEEPKPEQPQAEQPQAEQPQAEEPKAEQPKPEQPQAEQPQAEQPQAEQPKAPAAETSSAWSDAPDPTTRAVGAVWFALSLAALIVLVRRVFELEFGTQNPRILWVIRGAAIVVPGYPAALGLLTLITGRRPRLRYNPLAVPFEGWWYSTLGAMTWRELKRVFLHPVAYIVLFVFMVVNGILFWQLLDVYAGTRANQVQAFPDPATFHVSTTFFTWLSLILICPALTMRLLSEEDQSGTLEMLMTAPVSDVQIVLSKFLSMVLYFAFMVSVAHLAYASILQPYTPAWDWGPPLGAYLGQILVGAMFVSLGLFTSSVTKNQILAYLLAALALVILVFAPQIAAARLDGTEAEWVRPIVTNINIVSNQKDFARGIVHWKTLVFYVSTSTFFVFLAVRGVESHRWR